MKVQADEQSHEIGMKKKHIAKKRVSISTILG